MQFMLCTVVTPPPPSTTRRPTTTKVTTTTVSTTTTQGKIFTNFFVQHLKITRCKLSKRNKPCEFL